MRLNKIVLMIVLFSIFSYGCEEGTQQTIIQPTPAQEPTTDIAPVSDDTADSDDDTDTSDEDKGDLTGEYELTLTLEDIEAFLPNMDYLIGSSAPSSDVIIVTEIKTFFITKNIDTGDAKLTGEVDNYKDDFIMVGSPCNNPGVAALFKEEIDEKGDCKIFNDGEGHILLKKVSNNDIILYIGGNSPAETKKAAEVIKNHGDYELDGVEFKVTGTTGDLTAVKVE
ncbi:hypothetical protein ACFL6I_24045 [candidate division KSB1 bacterium]